MPVGLIGVLVAARFVDAALRHPPDPVPLYERASRAYAGDRFTDAAEYARHAVARTRDPRLRAELLCLRGESLLRSGEPVQAAEAFETVLEEDPSGPYVPQALFGSAEAHARSGEVEQAARARGRLGAEYPDTPWAKRALSAEPTNSR